MAGLSQHQAWRLSWTTEYVALCTALICLWYSFRAAQYSYSSYRVMQGTIEHAPAPQSPPFGGAPPRDIQDVMNIHAGPEGALEPDSFQEGLGLQASHIFSPATPETCLLHAPLCPVLVITSAARLVSAAALYGHQALCLSRPPPKSPQETAHPAAGRSADASTPGSASAAGKTGAKPAEAVEAGAEGAGVQREVLELQAVRDMAHEQAQRAIAAARGAQAELDSMCMDLHEAKAAMSLIKVRPRQPSEPAGLDCRRPGMC